MGGGGGGGIKIKCFIFLWVQITKLQSLLKFVCLLQVKFLFSIVNAFFICILKIMKLFSECVIFYFHYVKTILNDDLFNEYINLSCFY